MEWRKARKVVSDFLNANGFKNVKSSNGKWAWTYPLHEAVRQNNAYVCAKLLALGADPSMRNVWGRLAVEYVKDPTVSAVFELYNQRMRCPGGHKLLPGAFSCCRNSPEAIFFAEIAAPERIRRVLLSSCAGPDGRLS